MTLSDLSKYPLVFLVAFFATYAITPLIRAFAFYIGAVDRPETRRLNIREIPSAGGLAVFVGFHLACAVAFLLPATPLQGSLTLVWWQSLLPVSSLVLLIGLCDDVIGFRAITKLLLQIGAAIIVYLLDIRVGKILGVELYPLLDAAVTVFWILAVTNAFNLIDGMDGLATGLACIASIGIGSSFFFRHQPGDVLIALAITGACVAFLRYNFYPAKIFLGDAGSLFIGFTLAVMALSTASKGTMLASVGVPLLALGVPIFDTMLAVWRRSVRGLLRRAEGQGEHTGIMHFDMEHVHHRLLRAGLTQRRAALALYGVNAALVVVGLLSLLYRSHAVGIFLISFLVGTYIIVRHIAHTELWDSGSALLKGLRRPRYWLIGAMVYPLVDFLLLGVAIAAAISLSRYTVITVQEMKEAFVSLVPIWCTPPFIALCITGTYSRVWSRARVSEFTFLSLSIAAGALVAKSIATFLGNPALQLWRIEVVLFVALASVGITGVRALPRVIEDMMALFSARIRGEVSGTRHVLIYGAGARCPVYLRNLSVALLDTPRPVRVVGLLDDDRNLRKRLVSGHRVLGGIDNLWDILTSTRVDEIVVTTRSLDIEKKSILLSFAKRYGITVTEWFPREEHFFIPPIHQRAPETRAAM